MTKSAFHVVARGLRFPEGPAFSTDGSLWCVEMTGGTVVRVRPDHHDGHRLERFEVGGEPNGLAMRGDRPWICDAAGSLRRLDGGVAETVELTPGHPPLRRPNDLAFDLRGNLVFTCPGRPTGERHGQVWCRTSSGETRLIADGMRFPNGLAFTDDQGELIVAETLTGSLWRGEWDGAATLWKTPRPWVCLPTPVGPDGIAFGPDGRLYVALYGRGEIHAVGQDGRTRVCLRTPGSRPTNLAFDPTGRLGMVVTEAERGELLSYPASTWLDAGVEP